MIVSKLALGFFFTVIIFSALSQESDLPQLKLGKGWSVEQNNSPDIVKKYFRISGESKIKLVFTKYSVPVLKDEVSLNFYIKSMHPRVDKFELLNSVNCQSRFSICFISQVYISRFEKKNYISYVYFVENNIAYLGFTQVNGHSDYRDISDLLTNELKDAVAN